MPTAAEAVAWKEGPMRFGTFLLIGLVALGGTSCASAPSAPAGVDVSGKWQGPWQYQNASLGGHGRHRDAHRRPHRCCLGARSRQ